MKGYNSLKELFEENTEIDVGLTMGSFDGVHLGHQKLLNNLIDKCNSNNLKSVVITFSPHPREILGGDDEFLMFSEESRASFLEDLGIDFLVTYKFNRDFSTLGAEEFIEQFLIINEKVKLLHVGHDFSFGANKEGSFLFMEQYLTRTGKDYISFSSEEEFKLENTLVSSSYIRKKIKLGALPEANKFLGKTFFLDGLVNKGDGRGKDLGFPTANIVLSSKFVLPQTGVYVTQVQYGKRVYHSVTNVGFKPTFEDNDSVTIESHLFDFDQDIYGENIRVFFYEKIRDERKFNSVNELISQIKEDSNYSRLFWSKQAEK